MVKRIIVLCCLVVFGLGFVWACGFESSLREYLDAHFWLPFSKRASDFERSGVRRVDMPFAGMEKVDGDTPLANLRRAYQQISQPMTESFDTSGLRQAV